MEWGDPAAPPVIMWHGLARTGRDFDDLAATLAATYRVVCPDVIGRGLSQWSPLPDAEYCLEFYGRIARAFVDQLHIERLRWVGTSTGAPSVYAPALNVPDQIDLVRRFIAGEAQSTAQP